MSREISIWLDAHCSAGDQGVFRSVAELAEADVTDELIAISSGRELLELAGDLRSFGGPPIDHLVIAGHGGSTWLLDDEHGLTTGEPRHADQVSMAEWADAWAPVLSPRPLISLAACLCSRSPRWYLRWRWGRLTSDWGRRAYLPGGLASMSARIRDHLVWHGLTPRVRGHRAAGHASALALLAEHRWPAAAPCVSLFRLALPAVAPTIMTRRRWVRLVTGDLAQRWLLGDDAVVEEIGQRW
jgi:hypothetical protein